MAAMAAMAARAARAAMAARWAARAERGSVSPLWLGRPKELKVMWSRTSSRRRHVTNQLMQPIEQNVTRDPPARLQQSLRSSLSI
eukprot:5940081-Prymnesium_polylepis.1